MNRPKCLNMIIHLVYNQPRPSSNVMPICSKSRATARACRRMVCNLPAMSLCVRMQAVIMVELVSRPVYKS